LIPTNARRGRSSRRRSGSGTRGSRPGRAGSRARAAQTRSRSRSRPVRASPQRPPESSRRRRRCRRRRPRPQPRAAVCRRDGRLRGRTAGARGNCPSSERDAGRNGSPGLLRGRTLRRPHATPDTRRRGEEHRTRRRWPRRSRRAPPRLRSRGRAARARRRYRFPPARRGARREQAQLDGKASGHCEGRSGSNGEFQHGGPQSVAAVANVARAPAARTAADKVAMS
jgi:hypothetical protein